MTADGPHEDRDLPAFPGFREISTSRQRLLDDLVADRRARGLTQTEVAALMGTSQSAVARLEARGSDLRLSTLERYAGALDRAIEWRVAAAPGSRVQRPPTGAPAHGRRSRRRDAGGPA
jgi:transcriptional regulator with XRE-family HTH domain